MERRLVAKLEQAQESSCLVASPCNSQKVAQQDLVEHEAQAEERLPENRLPIRFKHQAQEAQEQASRQLDFLVVLVESIKLVLVAMAETVALPRQLAQVTLVSQAQAMVQAVEAVARQKERLPVLVVMAHPAIVS
jgi:hypothetical protein